MKMDRGARKPVQARATILVASDNASDASSVQDLLAPEFDQVFLSVDPDMAVEDFESRAPEVLVLAFNTLEDAERYYLGLYRLSTKIHLLPHRTITLCSTGNVRRAYEACRKESFDDYVQFWPMTNDAPRLLMSVHHALRDLSATRGGTSAGEFATHARQLAELGNMLDQQMAQGYQRIDVVNRSMEQAEQGIGVALDGLSSKLAQRERPDSQMAELEREIGQRFRAMAELLSPIQRWADDLKKECAPHIESARVLNAMADSIWPTILVVEDDDFQRAIVSQLFAKENYRLVFASGGIEALNMLRVMQPDLILMDILMPDLDGIETTRRLKSIPQFAQVPVIMITGNSEGVAVRDSLKAGATGFVVKPLDGDTLLAKVARALHSSERSNRSS